MLKIGNAELRRVEDMTSALPMSMFTEDKDFLAEHAHWLSPRFMDADGNCPMIFHSWVLVVDDKVVVIDPCAGNDRSFPHYPIFHMLNTPYIERFEATGIKPEEVDYVVCTHLHSDHCGWNTQLRDGKFVPTFPNARYIMVRREVERWDPRRSGHIVVPENEGVFESSVLPILEAGLAEIVDDSHSLLPSLTLQPAHGHTIGHSMLHMCSSDKEAYFTADAFHHPIEIVDPILDVGGAEDFDALVATRRNIIKLCIERNALMIPAHFPAPYMGWIREKEGQVIFEPMETEL